MLNLFGCSPPSRLSGDSSIFKCCTSIRSFDNNLNFPLHPHVHLLGSLNFVSICNIEIVFPHPAHSNFALVICGLTSDACLTIPSMKTNLPKCSLLMLL